MGRTLHPGMIKTLLIVYHSMTGGTRQMVEAAALGAAVEPIVRVRPLRAPATQAADPSSKQMATSLVPPKTWLLWPA